MFDDLEDTMRRFDGSAISVPIEADEHGYVDKQCPFSACRFIFKVHQDDWESIFQDAAVWCPLCRHEAPADQWFTDEQVEHAKSEAFQLFRNEINRALKSGANRFNRTQRRNSFISMKMQVRSGPTRSYVIPARAAEAMQLEIQCESCKSRFAIIGSAYFCPACGVNSVVRSFVDSLRKIRAKYQNIDIVRKALTQTVGKDEAELACRSLMETCISDGVTAFQKYCEELYKNLDTVPFNAFQRLQHGSQLWQTAIGHGYGEWLTDEELEVLHILYQKRHILAHNDGIVDQKYLDNTDDQSYVLGQRIVVSTADIENLIVLLEKLADGIKQAINDA